MTPEYRCTILQAPGLHFNRGALLNAGALLLQDAAYDCLVFHDVDTVCGSGEIVTYRCPVRTAGPPIIGLPDDLHTPRQILSCFLATRTVFSANLSRALSNPCISAPPPPPPPSCRVAAVTPAGLRLWHPALRCGAHPVQPKADSTPSTPTAAPFNNQLSLYPVKRGRAGAMPPAALAALRGIVSGPPCRHPSGRCTPPPPPSVYRSVEAPYTPWWSAAGRRRAAAPDAPRSAPPRRLPRVPGRQHRVHPLPVPPCQRLPGGLLSHGALHHTTKCYFTFLMTRPPAAGPAPAPDTRTACRYNQCVMDLLVRHCFLFQRPQMWFANDSRSTHDEDPPVPAEHDAPLGVP